MKIWAIVVLITILLSNFSFSEEKSSKKTKKPDVLQEVVEKQKKKE